MYGKETANAKTTDELERTSLFFSAVKDECGKEKAPEKKEYPLIEKARKVAEKYYKGRSLFKRNREKKEELDYILFSLENALKKKNAETVTLAYTALKYFVSSEFNLKINLDEIMKGISEEV